MLKQIKCHNEFTVFGRLLSRGQNVMVKNRQSLRVCLLCPNDNDYNEEPNRVYVDIIGMNNKTFQRGQALGITGHIDSKYGQRLIADVIEIIKEPINRTEA
jgi:hypothetical protein